MADELVLYTNPMSRGRVARWMLEEIGEPYKVEVVDYASTMKGPAYLAINPMGKVPALRHGDAVVTGRPRSALISPMPSRRRAWRHPPVIGCARPIIAGCFFAPVRSRPRLAIKRWASLCRLSASG